VYGLLVLHEITVILILMEFLSNLSFNGLDWIRVIQYEKMTSKKGVLGSTKYFL